MSGALLVGVLAGQPGSGCVLPPDLSPGGGDAGPSSPPVILEVTPADQFNFPGPIVVSRSDSPDMNLRVKDNDAGDVLFARLYRDYKRVPPELDPTPPLADCQIAPDGSGDLERLLSCHTNALCTNVPDTDNGNHILEVMVSDRPFLLESDPEAAPGQEPYRKVADFPQAGISFLGWVMRCQPGE
jgi:hypothetical protein